MSITFGDRLIDSGYSDITPEQEREIEAREECARRGLDPDDDAADGVLVWMVVDKEMQERRPARPAPECPHSKTPVNLSVPCQICGALGPWFDSCTVTSQDRS